MKIIWALLFAVMVILSLMSIGNTVAMVAFATSALLFGSMVKGDEKQ